MRVKRFSCFSWVEWMVEKGNFKDEYLMYYISFFDQKKTNTGGKCHNNEKLMCIWWLQHEENYGSVSKRRNVRKRCVNKSKSRQKTIKRIPLQKRKHKQAFTTNEMRCKYVCEYSKGLYLYTPNGESAQRRVNARLEKHRLTAVFNFRCINCLFYFCLLCYAMWTRFQLNSTHIAGTGKGWRRLYYCSSYKHNCSSMLFHLIWRLPFCVKWDPPYQRERNR